jgi:hypothetical protein
VVDLKVLRKHGVSSGAYKAIWSKDPAEYTPKQQRLRNLISGEIRDGFEMCLRDHRAFHAVDLAYEVPYAQTTPTLVNNILRQNLDYNGTRAALSAWGLRESDLFIEVQNVDGMNVKVLNPPVFFQIFIPIVKAYVVAVLGQIYNERDVNPLLNYKPLKNTDRNKVLCRIETDIIDDIATNYGYAATMRQGIHQMLKYGTMLAFTREEWHCDRQLIEEDGKEKRVTVKEGLRYIMPHPTRFAADIEFPWTAFNTDTGPVWSLYWHIMSYGSILDNRMFWNRRHIFAGTNWFQSPLAGNYFNEVFPCQMKFLYPESGPLSREDRMAWYNSSQDRDKAVFVTEYHRKLVPRDWDLADYGYPVWHRFTVAGDDTIIWCQPCAYNPQWFMGYDYDEQSARTPSLALDLIPYQDHLGNILSQMLLTMKQNLANVIFYDNQLVDKKDIDRLNNMGENKYRSVMFIPYDSFKNISARLQQNQAFTPVQFTKTPITELLQAIPAVLNIMGRVLGISPQTAGASATHQQSKEEVMQTKGADSNRISLISASVDEGIDAWKKQLHEASQAYLDPEFEAEISPDIKDLDKHLEELGFKVKEKGETSVLVTGHKHKLRLNEFASTDHGPQRERNREMAQVIFQTVGTVSGQPELFKPIGAKNLIKLIEEAAKLAGAPRDFELTIDPNAEDGEVPEKIIEAIKQAQQATLQQVEEKIAKPIAQEIAQDQGQIKQIEGIIQQLQAIYKVAQQENDRTKIKAQETQAKIQGRAAELSAAEHRKDIAAAKDQQRKDAKLISDLQMQKAELEMRLQTMQREAEAKIANEKLKADAAAKAKTAAAKSE